MAVTKTEKDTEQPKIIPSTEDLEDALTVELQDRVIDNPGGGDCGFYALSIGLIDVIQKEYNIAGRSKTYDQWQLQGLHDVSLQDILDVDLDQLYNSPRHYKKDLLFKLQMSLRTIACNLYQNEPINRIITEKTTLKDGRAHVEATPIFCKFMELVDFYLGKGDSLSKISQFNELAFSLETQRLAQETAQSLIPKLKEKSEKDARKIQIAHVKEVFQHDIVVGIKANPASVILKGVEKIKEKGRWATHYDLKEIADQLHVNLHVVGKENGRDKPFYPIITLYNEDNIHWVTRVIMAIKKLKNLVKPNEPLGVTSLPSSTSKKKTELDTELQRLGENTVTQKLPTQDRSSQKKEVESRKKDQPVIAAPEKEKGHNKNSSKSRQFLSKHTLFSQSDEIPLALIDKRANQKEFNRLIWIVNRAVMKYCTYSDGIFFSIFHRHGEEGRLRAKRFNRDFSSAEDLNQAKEKLIEYLQDSKNGNTHPHSFRTMLLRDLVATSELSEKKDLKYISKNYSELLAELEELLMPVGLNYFI